MGIKIAYEDRVTQQEDGSYRWRCLTEAEYERKHIWTAMKACVIIAVIMLAVSAYMGIYLESLQEAGIVVICVAVFLGIAFAVCLISDRLTTEPWEIYELTETYIKTGTGKTSVYFNFSRARKVIVKPNCLELKGLFGGPRVYAPPEDMSFVRSFILGKVPDSADISFE